ncbi:MAG TPA: cyclase family protein [Solirubrobacterales bacterium]|nr:cyclase family protein [Solirubrobacterales bacterium]
MALHDVSVPIRPGMPIYHDNPGYSHALSQAIADGATANVTRLDMGAHTGTHMDGPMHFYDGAPGADALDLAAMIGPCEVVEIPDRGLDPIDRAALEAATITEGAERVLLKTTNSRLWEQDEFTHDFIRLDGSGAEFVLERGIRLIGIDYLSIGDGDAHRALLGADPVVVALEGLDLREIEPGAYTLLCLPLKLIGTDGAPSRALLADSPDDITGGGP